MDIDYFFHENDFSKIKKSLIKYEDFPALAFPQYQFFHPYNYQIKTRLCIAFNKKKFPDIKLNGGGDLTLATLNNKLIEPKLVPNISAPIYQYDSLFRTKEIIADDRARFARAWGSYFGSFNDRGGPTPDEAYDAWFKMVKERYPKHTFKINLNDHPRFIKEKLKNIHDDQFGNNLFGLKNSTPKPLINYLKGYKEKYINPLTISKYKHKNVYK